jgi:hypothetical protein
MGFKYHLLGLTRIGDGERHPAMAEPEVRDLHLGQSPGQQDGLFAPIKLICLAWREDQRNKSIGRTVMAISPNTDVTPNAVIAAFISIAAKVIPDPRSSETLLLRALLILCQHVFEPVDPRSQPWIRLLLALIAERRCLRAQNLPNRSPAQSSRSANLLDALPKHKMVPTDLPNSLHAYHPC